MRRDLHLTGEGPTWRGLLAEADGPPLPALRVETTSDRRFRIVQGDVTVLWCRIGSDWYGVDLVLLAACSRDSTGDSSRCPTAG